VKLQKKNGDMSHRAPNKMIRVVAGSFSLKMSWFSVENNFYSIRILLHALCWKNWRPPKVGSEYQDVDYKEFPNHKQLFEAAKESREWISVIGSRCEGWNRDARLQLS
jgi:hypothetical protein